MMDKKYDPLQPRLNPEIEEILWLIKKNCDELIEEKNFLSRRGQARILIAHLEELVEQPEYFIDVEEGLIDDSRYWMKEGNFTDNSPLFLKEKPFDFAETTENLYFFYSNNKFSLLYKNSPFDPYYCPCLDYGFIVYTLEKLYTTQQETQVHINDNEVITNCLEEIKSNYSQQYLQTDNRYFILIDPLGVNYGLSLTVTTTNNYEEAIFIANSLTDYLPIRFLVAKQIYVFDTH
ncbi:hypothetical protein [Cyanobacterium sp. Dongsha4]|uniref:hypothetical protein n=1 Tax=Cyanobacterium sp. DS4 TaxID=2878255 RepID=UPI002E81F98F|nr:hypothetical protein [Cyanobacterium sp. Dongsha4]WVL00572.1 hypothetical protein Dongsha4_18325 [Cyanobacterium sp. Dongsha4]